MNSIYPLSLIDLLCFLQTDRNNHYLSIGRGRLTLMLNIIYFIFLYLTCGPTLLLKCPHTYCLVQQYSSQHSVKEIYTKTEIPYILTT